MNHKLRIIGGLLCLPFFIVGWPLLIAGYLFWSVYKDKKNPRPIEYTLRIEMPDRVLETKSTNQKKLVLMRQEIEAGMGGR